MYLSAPSFFGGYPSVFQRLPFCWSFLDALVKLLATWAGMMDQRHSFGMTNQDGSDKCSQMLHLWTSVWPIHCAVGERICVMVFSSLPKPPHTIKLPLNHVFIWMLFKFSTDSKSASYVSISAKATWVHKLESWLGVYLPTERLLTFTKGSGQIWWDELHGSLEALLEVLSVTLINGVEYKSNICNEGSCCGLCIAKLSDNLSSLPGNQPSSNAPSIYSEGKGYKYDWIKTTVYLVFISHFCLYICAFRNVMWRLQKWHINPYPCSLHVYI